MKLRLENGSNSNSNQESILLLDRQGSGIKFSLFFYLIKGFTISNRIIVRYSNGKQLGNQMAFGTQNLYRGC